MITKIVGKKSKINIYSLDISTKNEDLKKKEVNKGVSLLESFECVLKDTLVIINNGKEYNFSNFLFCEKQHYERKNEAIKDGFIINEEVFDKINKIENLDHEYLLFDIEISDFKKNIFNFFDFKSSPEFETKSLDFTFITSSILSETLLSDISYKNKALDFSSYKVLNTDYLRFIIKNDDGDFYVERKIIN